LVNSASNLIRKRLPPPFSLFWTPACLVKTLSLHWKIFPKSDLFHSFKFMVILFSLLIKSPSSSYVFLTRLANPSCCVQAISNLNVRDATRACWLLLLNSTNIGWWSDFIQGRTRINKSEHLALNNWLSKPLSNHSYILL
jgi:hypothetical protein